METRDCIKSRRSIRRFTEQPVADELICELLEAIRWSPSWANTQCWEIIMVKEPEGKENLTKLLAENNPAAKGLVEAPVVMVLCGKKGISGVKKGEMQTDKGDWYMFDLGIAGQNLCLAAHDMGLGTVHIGSFDHKAVDQLLGLPADVCSVEIIPVGYPAKDPNAPPRKDLPSFVHAERYGQTANLK